MPRTPKDPSAPTDTKAYWKSLAEMLAPTEGEEHRPAMPTADPAPGAGDLFRSALWQAGYAAGVADVYRALVENRVATIEKAEQAVKHAEAMALERARAAALRKAAAKVQAQSPAVKAARTKRLRRVFRDEAQAIEFAALIRAGHTTESARAQLGLGDVRARRIRAAAVRMGLIPAHTRGQKPPNSA